jgi:hypothetical protein
MIADVREKIDDRVGALHGVLERRHGVPLGNNGDAFSRLRITAFLFNNIPALNG